MEKRYDLNGEWDLRMEETISKNGKNENCPFEDSMLLPGTTALAKKGKVNEKRETGYLTELYPFEGHVWYSKEVEIDEADIGRTALLFLERTRMTSVYVDGVCAGSCNSLTTTHVYNLTSLIHQRKFRLTILVTNTGYPTAGGHLTSPDTQTNWNGILGRMELIFHDDVYISQIRVDSDVQSKSFGIRCTFQNTSNQIVKYTLKVSAKSKLVDQAESIGQTYEALIEPGESTQDITLEVGKSAKLWDEYVPALYELTVLLEENGEEKKLVTGLRSFKKDQHHFLINGQRTFLRGKHDAMVFPQTGAVPTELSEWIRVMTIAKDYGINHYRYHTCCPPEAAFEAADLLGIYLQPELPFWGTLAAPGEEGYQKEEEEYLIEEGFRMLEEFGNHPSFCMMSLGNELWGSAKRMGEILSGYQAVDRRHLYTQGSNNFQFYPVILPEDDFWSGIRLETAKDGVNHRLLRGSFATCDAPIGYIQLEEPSTTHSYDSAVIPDIKTEKELIPEVPIVVHETGQYAVYPDFSEIEKYQGPLRARNFEIFQERLMEKGMQKEAHDFFWDSGKLSAACYKEEIEAFLRSDLLAGFQLLDLQDYPGQGTALVGILNAFMENKGYCLEEEWREFCSDLVILAEFKSFLYQSGEQFEAKIQINNNRFHENISRGRIKYSFETKEQCVFEQKEIEIGELQIGLNDVGLIQIELPKTYEPQKLTLRLAFYQENEEKPVNTNHYDLWIYPQNQEVAEQVRDRKIEGDNGQTAYISTNEVETKALLEEGKCVIYFPEQIENSIQGTYCTDFWCYPMFRSISESVGKEVPIGTMGLHIQKNHPALRKFPTETYTTPQWYAIVSNAQCAVLEDIMPKEAKPIVQMIDNFERNHKLGILYEGTVSNGKLLVCTSHLLERTGRPEVRQFLKSIFAYTVSEEFEPANCLTMNKATTNIDKYAESESKEEGSSYDSYYLSEKNISEN